MAGFLRRRDSDMTQGYIWKQLLAFAIPMAIGFLFQQFYNTVDTIVVGQFVGKEALAAVGSTGSIINMLVGLCAGLATGAGVVISQCYGAHDEQQLHDAVHTTVVLALILSTLVTGLGMLIVSPMLTMMQTPVDVFDSARQYLTIYFAGVSGLILYNMGAGILRAVGDSQRPVYFLCISAVLNIVLDLLLVIRFDLGIAGVAYATIFSQFVSAALVLFTLTRSHTAYGLHWDHLRLDRDMLTRVFRIGLPSGIQQALTSFSNVFVQSYINYFGSSCMAGWSSYNKLDAYLLVPVQSIALASTTFVGQNYGAKNMARAKKGVSWALGMSIVITVLCAGLMISFAEPMIRLFTSDQEVVAFGVRFITLISPFYVLICFNQIYGGALRGIGSARVPMVIMLSSFVIFRQIYLAINKALGNAFVPVALAYPMGWLVCSALLTIFYRRSILFRAEAEPLTADSVPAD